MLMLLNADAPKDEDDVIDSLSMMNQDGARSICVSSVPSGRSVYASLID